MSLFIQKLKGSEVNRRLRFLLSLLFASSFFFASFSLNAFETSSKQAILIDAQTNAVLFEKNADQRMAPSSMSKMMTIYQVFEALKDGSLSLSDKFLVSEKAWRKGGSKMYVSVNSRVKVEELIRGVIVQSGNDASIVLAEGLSGSEAAFSMELNEAAKNLGMSNSNFTNASGWPDTEHYSSARDLAKLALATINNYPEYYKYYAEKKFSYAGIDQYNRNPTLYRGLGADGLKTGRTQSAGYGLTASTIRKDRRLILVVNGLPSKKARANESARILDWGYRIFDNYKLFEAGETVTDASVWMGDMGKVPLLIMQDLIITLPRKFRKKMKVIAAFNQPIQAPIKKGDKLGTLKIEASGQTKLEVPLYSGADVSRLGLILRLSTAIKYILWGESG